MTSSASSPEKSVPPGERRLAGRYTLRSPLGRGGMGVVWLAEDTLLHRDVAVKEVIFPPYVSDEERRVLRERTLREARAAARLDHPSVVTIFDVVEEDGQPYIVMELARARTLAEVVTQDGPLSPHSAAEVGLALLGALSAAHEVGVLHRDVKPANVLLRHDGRVTLTDFGIASSTGDSSITTTGLLLGSPSYMAPERACGDEPGPASDLWSLGATLFTAVEGRPPFDAGEPLPTLAAVVSQDHAPFRAAGPLAPVIDALLAKDPRLRPAAPQARQMLEAVTQAPAPPGVAVPFPGPAQGAAPPPPDGADGADGLGLSRTRALAREDVVAAVAAGALAPAATPALPPVAEPAVPLAHRPAVALRRGAAPAPRRSTRGGWVAAGLLGLAGSAAVVVASPFGDGGNAGPEATPTAQTSAAASPASPVPATPAVPSASSTASRVPPSRPVTPTPPPQPVADASVVPADWRTYRAPSGFTVRYPPGWQAVPARAGQTDLREPGTGRYLRLDTNPNPTTTPLRAWQAAAPAYARAHRGYDEIRIESVEYRGWDTADWEYTYRSSSGGRLHAINRNFIVADRAYALNLQTSEADWDRSKGLFSLFAASFQPAPG